MNIKYQHDFDDCSESITYTADKKAKRLPFYLESCGYYLSGDKYYTDRVGLNSYLLIYTVSGSGYLQYKGKTHNLSPYDTCLINCNERQLYGCSENSKWEFYWFHINGIGIRTFYDIINSENFEKITINDTERIKDFYRQVENNVKNQSILTDININDTLTQLITFVVRYKNIKEKKAHLLQHQREVEFARLYIHKHFAENISIDKLVAEVNLSKFYFLKLFKSVTGQSPYEYLTKYRINKAKQLLIETNHNINEISAKIGFTEANNFIKSFKKHTGTTPLGYRKNWNI